MKLQVIVAAMAMVLGTAAYADMTSVTTTTKTTSHHVKSGMHHHHGKYHRHHGKKHHHHNQHHYAGKNRVVKSVVVREEISPPGSVTIIK